jgi:Cu-Zn family superoxide dismutase
VIKKFELSKNIDEHIILYIFLGGIIMEYNNIIGYEVVMAISELRGSDEYPEINGRAIFKKKGEGVLVTFEVFGLPKGDSLCDNRIFALHIHEGNSCAGNIEDPFANAGLHFNPHDCEHPEHVGDLPPLFGNNGYAYMSVYTDKFMISDVIGKVVIIHEMSDNFMTQPSGSAGKKIACGKILII